MFLTLNSLTWYRLCKIKLQKQCLCKDCKMRVWDKIFIMENKGLKLIINTWNTGSLLFPLNISFLHWRINSVLYQIILTSLSDVDWLKQRYLLREGSWKVTKPKKECESADALVSSGQRESAPAERSLSFWRAGSLHRLPYMTKAAVPALASLSPAALRQFLLKTEKGENKILKRKISY